MSLFHYEPKQHVMKLASRHPNDDYLEDLGAGVWLMDDHRWALIAWERCRGVGQRYVLMHADYHWDGVDDIAESPEMGLGFIAADLPEVIAVTKANELVRFDSFIAAAVRRGFISEVHFYCTENDTTDKGLDESLCDENKTSQFIYLDPESFARIKPAGPVIFDLCLDLFNASDKLGEGDLWSDADVTAFIDAVAHHIRSAIVVTVSMSFGYSGSDADTRHLTELVVPRILKLRAG